MMVEFEKLSNPVYAEIVRMDKRELDGRLAYRTTQAQLRLSRLQAGISDLTYTEFVYKPMEYVINKINSGNWLDAYNVIFEIIPNAYLTAEMILNFKMQIANYIVNSYNEYLNSTVNPLTGVIS